MEGLETIVLGGGCFWCVEAIFQRLDGVKKVESGYSGGESENPSYEEVSTGNSGHVEVIKITFDPKEISLKTLLEVFFKLHDPTTLNRQGNDVGEQYRSVIFFENEDQKKVAEEVLPEAQKDYKDTIVTTIESLKNYYKAEGYHQNYFNQNKNAGYCRVIIDPKIHKLFKEYKSKIKEEYAKENE